MTENICRLCLTTSPENNLRTIEESLKHSFCQLFLKLNMDISLETGICNDCEDNLQAFFNFTSTCDHMKKMIDNVGLDFEDPENTKSVEDQIRCYFCRDVTVKENITSLNESKENIFLIKMLNEYVPDLDFSHTGDVLTCEICLNSLQGFSNFIKSCLDVEDRIKRYAEIEGTNDNGQICLKDVKQFTFKSTIKLEQDILESYEKNQKEFGEYAEVRKLDIKIDEIDIKSEQFDESIKESPAEIDNGLVEMPEYKSEIYSYVTKSSILKCESCPYKTKYPNKLKKHRLIHKSPSELSVFKCEQCTYETRHKQYFKTHKLMHKNPSEITTFKCEMCKFNTKDRRTLNKHILDTHENLSEKKWYKCECCSFLTKHKASFTKHKWIHNIPSELTVYKCESCTYETKFQAQLKRHNLTHSSTSEMSAFTCDLCSYQTNQKRYFDAHELIHKSPSEILMFRCETCTFETKHKGSFKRHVLSSHQNQAKLYKCYLCHFITKRKTNLQRHTLIHSRN